MTLYCMSVPKRTLKFRRRFNRIETAFFFSIIKKNGRERRLSVLLMVLEGFYHVSLSSLSCLIFISALRMSASSRVIALKDGS